MKVYNKLVRDKVPDIIRAEGLEPRTRWLEKHEYLSELVKKLQEETDNFTENQDLEHLAELQEIVLSLADALDIKHSDLAKAVSKKTLAEGAYKRRIYLEMAENE